MAKILPLLFAVVLGAGCSSSSGGTAASSSGGAAPAGGAPAAKPKPVCGCKKGACLCSHCNSAGTSACNCR